VQVGDLERALALNRLDDRHWSVVADPDHESVNAMYGGWTVGVMLGAVEQAAMGGDATPSAITANFVKRIEPGSEVGISVRRLDGSRSVSHWLAEMSSLGGAETLAISSIVLSAPRPSDGHMQATMPDAPDPETLEVFHPPGSQGAQVVMRPITGFPPYGRTDTLSTAWVRDISHRRIDYQQLAYLADLRAPRSFHWGDGPRSSATMTLSVYFHATEEELARVGDDYLLSEAFGVRGSWSTSEEHLRLWSPHGELLATSEQLARYR
jgi:acyl-CoA thioesterase